MPVDKIASATNPDLTKVLQGREKTAVPLASSPLNTVKDAGVVAIAARQNLSADQQAALLGSEALQALNLVPSSASEPLLAKEASANLTTVLESPALSPAQQAALAVNETVQAAAGQGPTPAQQAALTVNQAMETLSAPVVPERAVTPPVASAVAGQAAAPAAVPTAAEAVAAVEVASAAPTAEPTEPISPATEPPVGREETPVAPRATAQQIQYQNAVAVYEVRNPSPPPDEPRPMRKDLNPPLPIGRARRIDPLVLRQEWEKRKQGRSREAGGQEETTATRPPPAEKAIRQVVRQANEDLAASGVPLQLVLVKGDEGYSIDVYGCSDEAVCEVEQEVPLDLNDLLTVLDNLEHEDGIIVNIKT